MKKVKKIYLQKKKRYRKIIKGIETKPRLSIFRSNNHIYAQLIDDSIGHTLVSMSSLDNEYNVNLAEKSKLETAYLVGEKLAEKAISKGIKDIVFDRDEYKFKGRIKNLIQGARKPIKNIENIFDNLNTISDFKKLNF
jgi:large subunit ribosomal protein L18